MASYIYFEGAIVTQYQRGVRFEYKVKKEYEERGCYVIRSAGSHGLFDLVAVDETGVEFIQCKYGCDIKESELQQLHVFAKEHPNISVVYAHGSPRQKTRYTVIT